MHDQNMWVTEKSVIHIEGSEKSANNIDRASTIYVADGIFRYQHILVLRHAWLF
jgi:hypothetical protein